MEELARQKGHYQPTTKVEKRRLGSFSVGDYAL